MREQRLCPIIDGKQWITCRYNQDEFTADIENQCTTIEELNEFAACQQGCEEIFPGMNAKKNDLIEPIDNSGSDYPDEYPDEYPDDYDDDIAALGTLQIFCHRDCWQRFATGLKSDHQ